MAHLMETQSVLIGDNTIPGVKVHKEVLDKIPEILQVCADFGLSPPPIIVEFLTYDEISEVAAYGGFPVRYPHWSFGEEYEELSKGYEHGMHRIYEMVVNTTPAYIYCLDSNLFVDHVDVIAHATGHADFFRNNVHFAKTSQNMMNELANHGSRIRRYMSEWGKDTVSRFIDKVLAIRTLIDPAQAWVKRQIKEPLIRQKRQYRFPRRLKIEAGHNHMENWIHTPEWNEYEKERIKKEELAEHIGLFAKPEKDIFGYIKDHAPLKPWQQDIIAMLYEEEMYFAPQRQTKMINEGWASYVDSQIMARFGLAEGSGIFDYALHKAFVLGGPMSMNPYKMGYMLFLDIEERWNKGRFGHEWEDCEDIRVKEKWDKKLGLGHEKVFETREFCDDVTMLAEFFTPEFCQKHKFFQWKKFPTGETKIVNREYKAIRDLLIRSKLNGGLPEIKLTDPNYKGKNIFLMEHTWDGRTLHVQKTKDTLKGLNYLWSNPVALVSKNKDGQEIMFYCEDDKADILVTDK